eukprot:GHUV01049076.1.p1 GENE.GHUV01049076.1~~GHUV01049076.1.p1  ORF type:complete len:107 (-),score=6.22 GHUV01049076.1:42-362(-)
MMLIGVVLIPVRAGQLYSRLSERALVAGHAPGHAPGCKGAYIVLSGRLSDVRGFNDLMQDFLVQVMGGGGLSPAHQGTLELRCSAHQCSVSSVALIDGHRPVVTTS